MIDLNDYFYFVQLVEKQGISAAAEAMAMPKSRLSRHLKQLEERLNTRLIQRTSRQFHITDAGHTFYQHARTIIDEMELAEAAMQSTENEISGRIRLSCSVGVAQFAIKELLVQFLSEHPGVELLQQVTNQYVDVVASGVDLAVRGHVAQLPDSSLIQRHLADVPWHLFASGKYLENKDQIKSPYDLFQQSTLKVGWQSAAGEWQLENASGLKTAVTHSPIFCCDDMSTLKAVAVAGLGIVALPSYTCKDELRTGLLHRVLPDWQVGQAKLSLVMPSRKGVTPAVKALRDFLLKNVSEYLEL